MTAKLETNSIFVSGTGKMGIPLLRGILEDKRYQLIPFAISEDSETKKTIIGGTPEYPVMKDIQLIRLNERMEMLPNIWNDRGPFILVDAVPAVDSQPNAEFYSQFDSMPVIMMSTGIKDPSKIRNTLILPNACLQIMAVEKFIAGLEAGLFADECYSLSIEEAHQRTKPRVSGTACKMVPQFNRLGLKFEEKQIKWFRGEEHDLRLCIPKEFWGTAYGYHKYTITSTIEQDMRLRVFFSMAEDFFSGNGLFNNLGYYQEFYGKTSSEYNDKTILWGSQFVDMIGYRTFSFGIHLVETEKGSRVEVFHTILGHGLYVQGVINHALPFMQEKCMNGLTGENFSSIDLYDWAMNR